MNTGQAHRVASFTHPTTERLRTPALHPQLGVLAAQPGQLGVIVAAQALRLTSLDLVLLHPVTQGLLTHPKITSHPAIGFLVSRTIRTASWRNSASNRRRVSGTALLIAHASTISGGTSVVEQPGTVDLLAPVAQHGVVDRDRDRCAGPSR